MNSLKKNSWQQTNEVKLWFLVIASAHGLYEMWVQMIRTAICLREKKHYE